MRKLYVQSSDICDVPLYSMGCLRPALADIRHFANVLSALSSTLIVVMVTIYLGNNFLEYDASKK